MKSIFGKHPQPEEAYNKCQVSSSLTPEISCATTAVAYDTAIATKTSTTAITVNQNQEHDIIESTTTRIECEYAEESDLEPVPVPVHATSTIAQESHDRIQKRAQHPSFFVSSSSISSSPQVVVPTSLSSMSSQTPLSPSLSSSPPMELSNPSASIPTSISTPVHHNHSNTPHQEHSQQRPVLELDLQEVSFTLTDKSIDDASHVNGSTEITNFPPGRFTPQQLQHQFDLQQQQQDHHRHPQQHPNQHHRHTYHHQRPDTNEHCHQQRDQHHRYSEQLPISANQQGLQHDVSHKPSPPTMPLDQSESMHVNGPSTRTNSGDNNYNRRTLTNRRSWSPNDVLHSSSGGGGAMGYQHTQGYLTPPRQFSDGSLGSTSSSASSSSASSSAPNSRQSSVATSISLLTDAAILAKYRETAIKTQDAAIQMSFAKYLLEIGETSAEFVASTAASMGRPTTPPLSRPSSVAGSESGGRPSSSSSFSDTPTSNTANTTASTPTSSTTEISPAVSSTSQVNAAVATIASPPAATPPSSSSILPQNSINNTEKTGKRQLTIEAMYWIDRLAKEGHPEAQFIKGSWFEDGLYLCKKSADKAFRWFQSASKGEYGPAHYKVGYFCEQRKDHNKAVMLYKKAATHNDVPASHRLAMVYFYGELGQQKNMKAGLQYLKRAAMLATEAAPMAPYVLGLILAREYDHLNQTQSANRQQKKKNQKRKPLNIPDDIAFPDDNEALLWFRRSAELGYGPANYKLGYCYEYGVLGCPVDPFLSVQHYERATWSPFNEHSRRYSMGAGEGDNSPSALDGVSNANSFNDSSYGGRGEAEMALSGWYLSGAEGYFPANDVLAFHYGCKAAAKGLAKAQYAVGYYHEVGLSIAPDMEKALEYYRLSAAQGNKEALSRLELYKQQQQQQQQEGSDFATENSTTTAVSDTTKKQKKTLCSSRSKQGGGDRQGCSIM